MTHEAIMKSGKPAGFKQPKNYDFDFGSELHAEGLTLSASADGYEL